MDLAFSTASQPSLRAAASGPPARGFARRMIAIPQYAIAQSGSLFATSANALAAGETQNECSMAIARSNCCWAAEVQDTGKCTFPNFSGSPIFSWAVSMGADQNTARIRNRIEHFIDTPPRLDGPHHLPDY